GVPEGTRGRGRVLTRGVREGRGGPISGMGRGPRTVSGGGGGPKEKNPCPPAPGARAETARDRNSSAPGTVYGGSVHATSNPPSNAPGSGSRRACSINSAGEPSGPHPPRPEPHNAPAPSATLTPPPP